MVLAFIVIAGGVLLTQQDVIQASVLDAIGLAPTATYSPNELVTQARGLQAQGDITQAARLYEQALAMRPDLIDWIYEYGLLQMELENYPEAVRLGDVAIDLEVYNPLGYALKARGMVWQGDASGAIRVALSGLNVDGQFATLHAMLGRAYTMSGNLSAGIESAERGVAIDPGNAEARRALAYSLNYAASYDAATQELETALALEPGNVSIAMELAYQYLALNRDEEAIDMYNTVLRIQPRNSRAMLRLCRAYRKVGQFDEALTQCENSVRADPSYVTAQFELGRIRYSVPYRNFADAQSNFEACVALAPANIECLFRLGLTHYYLFLAGNNPNGCRIAWDMLVQAQQMGVERTGIDATMEDIRIGMEHVNRDCPGNLSAQIPLELTPVSIDMLTATPGD